MSRSAQLSFAAGVLSPELHGRVDQAAYQVGLAECDNAIVRVHGTVQNRGGFEYCADMSPAAGGTALIPFHTDANTALLLAFYFPQGVGYMFMRVYSAAAAVIRTTKTISAVAATNPMQITTSTSHTFGSTDGSRVILDGLTGDFARFNGREFTFISTGASTFTVPVDATGLAGYVGGGSAKKVYEVSLPNLGVGDPRGFGWVQDGNVLRTALFTCTYVAANNWTIAEVNASNVSGSVVVNSTTPYPSAGSTIYEYLIQTEWAVGFGTAEQFAPSPEIVYGVGPYPYNYGYCGGKDPAAGVYNVVNFTTVPNFGMLGFVVYRRVRGLWAYVGYVPYVSGTTTYNFTDPIYEGDLLYPPVENVLVSADLDNPRFKAMAMIEGRVAYGGRWPDSDTRERQDVLLSRQGTPEYFSQRFPNETADALRLRMRSKGKHEIRHLVALEELFVFTDNGYWVITSRHADVLEAATIQARQLGNIGVPKHVGPVVQREAVLFPQAPDNHIGELKVSDNGYSSRDISVRAPHLYERGLIQSLTVTNTPEPILWAVLADGSMLGITYSPEQEVIAHHTHRTDGAIKYAVAVRESGEDVLYLQVERTIDGESRTYLERLRKHVALPIEDSFFVDSGVYRTPSGLSVAGLGHLEGKTVAVYGGGTGSSGAYEGTATVANGQITLPVALSEVLVGLPYTSTIKTLPVVQDRATIGLPYRGEITEVIARVSNSRGVALSAQGTGPIDFAERTLEPYGDPVAPVSGRVMLSVTSDWAVDPWVAVTQTRPLPITLCALQVGGSDD